MSLLYRVRRVLLVWGLFSPLPKHSLCEVCKNLVVIKNDRGGTFRYCTVIHKQLTALILDCSALEAKDFVITESKKEEGVRRFD